MYCEVWLILFADLMSSEKRKTGLIRFALVNNIYLAAMSERRRSLGLALDRTRSYVATSSLFLFLLFSGEDRVHVPRHGVRRQTKADGNCSRQQQVAAV
jgi:hypothetical protein